MAGLAHVAKYVNHCAYDGRVQISVMKNDEWRVATQFHRNFLDRIGRLPDQYFADFGRTGERNFAHIRTGHDGAANVARLASKNIDHAVRNPHILCQLAAYKAAKGCG
jgi:hypothetical protein